jgi:hypothetical protein
VRQGDGFDLERTDHKVLSRFDPGVGAASDRVSSGPADAYLRDPLDDLGADGHHLGL